MSQLENESNGDFDADKEREFCVRDIPPNVDDWAVFNVFKQYGIIESVRFPAHQPTDAPRYCFVSMINIEGASSVRNALNNGKLIVGNHALRVSDARGSGVQHKKPYNGRFTQPQRNGYQARRSAEFKKYEKICYPTADLPLGVPEMVSSKNASNNHLQAKIVPSPFPSNVKEGMTFHLLNFSKVPGEAYTELQQEMNNHCHDSRNECGSVEIGEAVLFYRSQVAYRAIQNNPDTVYLVDMGRHEKIMDGKLYRMLQKFAVLPSLVITCALARVAWTQPSKELFNSVRQIVRKWCETEGTLTATVEYFQGGTNMIKLEGSADTNLANSLRKRGDVTILPPLPDFIYSREEIIRIGKELNNNNPPCGMEIRNAAPILLNKLTQSFDDLVI